MLTWGGRLVASLILALCSGASFVDSSHARGGGDCSGELAGCMAVAKKTKVKKTVPRVKADTGAKNGDTVQRRIQTPPPEPEFDVHKDAYLPLLPGGVCGMAGFGSPSETCRPRLETDPEPDEPDAEPVTIVTITPHQAALMAAAYLPLQPGRPTVGPPPELNKWKMAAVGYPLWIWAEGNLDPAPVSRSVSGLSVSLDANLSKITYDMGDGTKVTCAGPGTLWVKGKIAPGTPSPDCGHTYIKPSLPSGSYTITATTHWAVAWTAGGQSGTIPFTQTSTTALPVGEIQTLVR